MNFEYSTNATDLTTGTWTNVAALNFVTPDTVTTGAKNGNAAADRTALSSVISALGIPNGVTFWIRWTDLMWFARKVSQFGRTRLHKTLDKPPYGLLASSPDKKGET